jgi:lipoprotein-anchoring transpeptidase ErfK/SrfK
MKLLARFLVLAFVSYGLAMPATAAPAKQKTKSSKSSKPAKSTKSSTSAKSMKSPDATRPRTVDEAAQTPTASKPARPEKAQKQAPLNVREIKEAEQRLADLGYWTGPIDGKFDDASRHALVAFQKVTGRKRTGVLNRSERAALMRGERPMPVNAGPAHIEVDLDRQVLFMVDDNAAVQRILPVSTGSGEEFHAQGYWRTAITPAGHLSILKKIKGWKKSPLGELYYPNYIVGGIAIHGHKQIPAKPASHGCIRIPMFAAIEFFKLAPVGMDVFVLFKPEPVTVLPD